MLDFKEIVDEIFHYSKYGKKENRTNEEKNKHDKAGLQYHDTIHHYQPAYQICLLACTILQQSLTKIISFNVWKGRKLDKYREE